jgi:hypothetical protein
MAKIDYDKIDNDLSEMKWMSIILEDYLNQIWNGKADDERRRDFNLPKLDGLDIYVLDDQTTEVAMFAALKLGDMIREAVKNYQALAEQDEEEKAAGASDE